MGLRNWWYVVLLATASVACVASVESYRAARRKSASLSDGAGAARLEFSRTRLGIRNPASRREPDGLRGDSTSAGAGHARSFAGRSGSEFQDKCQLYYRDRRPRTQRPDSGECRASRGSYCSRCGARVALSSCSMQWRSHGFRGQGGVFQSLGKKSTRMTFNGSWDRKGTPILHA